MRDHGGRLSFMPRLPDALEGLSFGLMFRGRRLRVRLERDRATYTLGAGEELEISHHGEAFTLTTARPQERTIPPAPKLDPPTQPAGRAPARRRRDG
jgi:alpha,alpha-trehalose phosphorylase